MGAASLSYDPTGNSATATGGIAMYDVLFVALGIAGFAVCVGYVYLCDRL
jgi:hypothetical protein